MRDVVVIGGGLSGLAAAYELEQQSVSYTLIEVKPRLGGSVLTVEQDGFVVDGGPFALEHGDFLTDLGLQENVYDLTAEAIGFQAGTGALVDHLAGALTGAKMMRMAVSSIGELDGRYVICLENGLVLDARALVIALPARYAARVFYGYITEITDRLLDYHYDTIQRLALGYRLADVPHAPDMPPDMAYTFAHSTTHPARVPQDHILLQIGVRIDPARCEGRDLAGLVTEHFGLPPQPVTQRVDFWPEADPLSCYDSDHAEVMSHLRTLMPPTLALVGSDYSLTPPSQHGIVRLDERIQQGRNAARYIAQQLTRSQP